MLKNRTLSGAIVLTIVSACFLATTATAQSSQAQPKQAATTSSNAGSNVTPAGVQKASYAKMQQDRQAFEAFIRQEKGERAYLTMEERQQLHEKFKARQAQAVD